MNTINFKNIKTSISYIFFIFTFLIFSNNTFAQNACCTGNILLNGGYESSFSPNVNFPYGSGTNNSRNADPAEWGYADGSNSNGIYLIDDATRASEGDQFIYVRDFDPNPTYNQCVGNTVSFTTSASCSTDRIYSSARYVVKMDFIPFNMDVPGGGTGVAAPRMEHAFPAETDLYTTGGTLVSNSTSYTAVDWADVATSWITVGGVTPTLSGSGNKTLYYSNAQDATCGLLFDNMVFEMLLISDAGLSGVTCGGSSNEITFSLNPTSNVPAGVPSIVYDVSAPAGYTISPTQGTYNQSTAFTLTKDSGDFSSGSPASVGITINDEVNTNCSTTATIINPYPCTGFTDSGLTVGSCNNAGTSANPSDDSFTFSLNPSGVNLGSTYNVSGDVTASGISYGSATTFNNGGSEFLISGGDLSITITDVSTGSTLAVTVTAPASCSNANDIDCDGIGDDVDTDDGNPCAPNPCPSTCDFLINQNISLSPSGGNTTGGTVLYFLTNSSGDIIATSSTASFSGQSIGGFYYVYILVYENAATLINASVGGDILNVGFSEAWACYDMSCPLVLEICESGAIGNRVWLDEDGDGDQDAGEPGIPGVVVELQDGSCTAGSTCPTTITDANGGFIFTGIAPGTYTVKVLSNVPTGMNAIYDEDDGTSSPDMEAAVILGDAGEYVTADFGYNYVSKADADAPTLMTATGGLGDRIWNDADSDGIQDVGESGIDNITVYIYNDNNDNGIFDNLVASTTTDANGNYFFDNLTPDAYVIEIASAGLASAGFTTTPTSDPDNDGTNMTNPVVIAPGDVWLGGDFGYNNSNDPADIGSQIFVDVDGDGSFNSGNDLPLGGVTVALIKDADNGDDWDSGEELLATTVTAADGTYLFPDLPAGDYVVVVTDVNNIINDLTNSVDPQGGNDGISGVTLGTADILNQNFGYVPSGHTSTKGFIGDLIYLDVDGNAGYSASESGIEGVQIKLLNGDTDVELAQTFTNENGQYFFGNLNAGNYKVKVETSSLPSGLTNSVDPDGSSPGDNITNSFALGSGAEDLTKDFGYTATTARTIAGTIWKDENAEGTLDGSEADRFSGVTIILIDANDNILSQTTTDASGAYSFTGIPAGTYTVEVTDDLKVLEGFWHSPVANDNENDPVVVNVSSGNVTGVDFGYYRSAASLGNFVWLDYDGDGIQDSNEPGLEGAEITLEIDYNGGGTDLTVVQIAGLDGAYSFDHLLLDEDYQGDGAGTEPTYTLSVLPPNNHAYFNYTLSKDAGSNDNLDADDNVGVLASPQQGKIGSALTNVTDTHTSYDFAFDFDCSQPSVEYAITMDGSNSGAAQTTNHFLSMVDGKTRHQNKSQKYGSIRSYTYCVHGEWHYYFNPMDPEEYLFAIRHNSLGGILYNTTEIEYIEIRMDQTATNRHAIGNDNAAFVMMRDWHVQTKNNAALTAPVDIRFYFPENEFADMFNSADNQARNVWGVGGPQVGQVKWFKKDTFNPSSEDIFIPNEQNGGDDSNGDGGVFNLLYDITLHQASSTDVYGSNEEDTTTDGGQDIGQNKNHIQFNALPGFSGGTAQMVIEKSALPVELSDFFAKVFDCHVQLGWATESEMDFDYFELQWSGDGREFKTMKIIDSKGNGTATRQAYHFRDRSASTYNYYRLKMVDVDGSYEYSKTIHATTECENNEDLLIYPNPLLKDNGKLNVQFNSTRADAQIQIIDLLGRVVRNFDIEADSNSKNIIQLNVDDLPSGKYFLQVVGTGKSKMFSVQE